MRYPTDYGHGNGGKEKGTDLRFDLEIDSMGVGDVSNVGDEDEGEVKDAPGLSARAAVDWWGHYVRKGDGAGYD